MIPEKIKPQSTTSCLKVTKYMTNYLQMKIYMFEKFQLKKQY